MAYNIIFELGRSKEYDRFSNYIGKSQPSPSECSSGTRGLLPSEVGPARSASPYLPPPANSAGIRRPSNYGM